RTEECDELVEVAVQAQALNLKIAADRWRSHRASNRQGSIDYGSQALRIPQTNVSRIDPKIQCPDGVAFDHSRSLDSNHSAAGVPFHVVQRHSVLIEDDISLECRKTCRDALPGYRKVRKACPPLKV